jgi:hypothetical protein
MSDPVEGIAALIRSGSDLARREVAVYAPVVESIVRARSTDARLIEHTLDVLLGFCFDPEALLLYEQLCRHYDAIDPAAVADHVRFYREMRDSEPEGQPRAPNGVPAKVVPVPPFPSRPFRPALRPGGEPAEGEWLGAAAEVGRVAAGPDGARTPDPGRPPVGPTRPSPGGSGGKKGLCESRRRVVCPGVITAMSRGSGTPPPSRRTRTGPSVRGPDETPAGRAGRERQTPRRGFALRPLPSSASTIDRTARDAILDRESP